MLLMISFRLLMYSGFSDSLCSRAVKCLVCQSNDFWKVVFTGLNWSSESRVREALKQYVNLIMFSISAGDFCPFFCQDIVIKMTFVYVLQQTKPQIKENICILGTMLCWIYCRVTLHFLTASCMWLMHSSYKNFQNEYIWRERKNLISPKQSVRHY